MRAIVALAAAYAVVLQATLVAIGGPLAGPAGVAAGSLCAQQTGGSRHSPASGGERGCLGACLACCCGVSVPPAAAPALAYRSVLPRQVTPAPTIGLVVPPRFARAHRSRAPPLG